jgi:hypothetical protein
MRTNRPCSLAIVAVVTFAIAVACYAGVLDGTHGKVKMIPDKATADKGEKGFEDTLSFADGKFTSTFFLARGFKPATYNGEKEENEAEFEVEQTSTTNGVVNWLGEIRSKKLVGRLTWKKADGTNLMYDFDGPKE